jgi:hypothetical protein
MHREEDDEENQEATEQQYQPVMARLPRQVFNAKGMSNSYHVCNALQHQHPEHLS